VQSNDVSVGSVLTAETGQIASWGQDLAALLHAEVVTIKRYLRPGNVAIPSNLRLYTSLEPCYMCSGLIHDVFSGKNLTVISGQKDPRISGQQLPTGMADVNAHITHTGLAAPYAQKLDTKRENLHGLAQHSTDSGWKKQRFGESSIEQAKALSGRRSHAKSVLRILELGQSIASLPIQQEKDHLAAVVSHINLFLTRISTATDFRTLVNEVSAWLDNERGKNPYKQTEHYKSQHPEYATKKDTAPGERKYAQKAGQLLS
jgi:tRNA(Arg) A34 adenosine deaminase TadA